MDFEQAKFKQIYAITRMIPFGKVATYGQISRLVPGTTARMVGYAMAAANEEVPWQRVINSQGRVSQRKNGSGDLIQAEILHSEGILFKGNGSIDLSVYQWNGPN